MGKEFYFETDDRLGRKKYAEFLKTLLEHCDEYRREDSDGAYVIAIDSPWGTGKTRFAKMLRNYLEDRTKEMGDDSAPGGNASFNAIYYNSWDTDFSNDALQPLIHSITNSPEFEKDDYDEAGKEIYEKFKKTAVAVAKVVGLGLIHHFFGETAKDIASAIDNSTSEKTPDPLEEYQSKLDILKKFKDSLQALIELTKHKKLVIIIDELDRCRPTFAIQTLEIAKHLFSVSGLFFIFALDVQQLSCSVRTVYGSKMDASGYLCRFFDYIGRIPSPDLKKFIKSKFSEIDYYKTRPSYFLEQNVEYMKRLAIGFHYSLRDLDTVIQSYSAMNKYFLETYSAYYKHHIYLFLLSLKYKDIDLFNKIFKTTPLPQDFKFFNSEKYSLKSHDDYSKYLIAFENESLLKNAFLNLRFLDKRENDVDAKILFVDTSLWEKYKEISIQFKYEPGNNTIEYNSNDNSEISWGHVLFKEDLAKWDSIKEKTIADYLYSQLEMFNFALPSDEPAKPE